MAGIRQHGTDAELMLRRALWRSGVLGYRVNVRNLPGKPDIVFSRWRMAVFVDGAFWHGHPSKFPEAKMSAYWRSKIAGNRARDVRVARELEQLGWRVMRIWDFEVAANIGDVIARITFALQLAGRGRQRVG